jgi:hypothetical protein
LFLQENDYQPSNTGWVERKEMYQQYKDFVLLTVITIVARGCFSERLQTAKYQFVKSYGIWYVRIEKQL